MTKRSSMKRSSRANAHPSEPPTETITPAIGPNPDGLTHMALLAHAPDDDEARAKIARSIAKPTED